MLSKINKFIAVFLIVALALYVVLLNRDSVTLRLSSDTSISTNGGVIFIGIFAAGILCAGLVGVFFGMRSYLRERQLQRNDRRRTEFYDGLVHARSLQAAHEFAKARRQWEELIRRDPTNIIARVELSRSLQGEGQIKDALKVLDEARAQDPSNVEVLFRAAEINIELGNRTAAVDNLALILYHHPNARAAELAGELSESLERIEDAREYYKQLRALDSNAADDSTAVRLEYKNIMREQQEDPEALLQSLRRFVKQYPDFDEALQHLAGLEKQAKRYEEAAELFVRAGRASGRPDFWKEAAFLWVQNGMPDRAMSAVRAATKETKGHARVEAELNLIRMYIFVNMLEDARKGLDGLPHLVRQLELELTEHQIERMLVLRGLCLSRNGDVRGAAETLRELADREFRLQQVASAHDVKLNGDAPAPHLSTP